MQLARAEGGRLRLDRTSDLREPMRLVSEDFERNAPGGRLRIKLPDQPVVSDLDPDAIGILFRNLIENALRHGSTTSPVEVTLAPDGELIVTNDGPVVPPDILARLAGRFERAGGRTQDSGLGLAIVNAIAERIGSRLMIRSPRSGAASGFEAIVRLPVTKTTRAKHTGPPVQR